ncbi:methylated-DNA--[protein]-cysteine S-methyltransferase [Sphingosinicella terrae]|uniref:methylated-DNA--[protein]-cysteine S-methyltransferase n=1 Tax=Sphingosinicella terrae TaxID=2172047 RepID=UPI000E0CE2B8|nr:methylated-DNA--[protein]-cysteine S-methyltransferase [Sphingosinicella terrae]
MPESGYTLFETPVGRLGIAWKGDVLAGIHLPASGGDRSGPGMSRRFPGVEERRPPKWVEGAIESICGLLGGVHADLSAIPLDLAAVGAFEASVYRASQAIPPGCTVTYGELATRIGDRGAARAVGQALGRNPWPIVVPCHRVTAADGRFGGFSAPGGISTKRRLLEIEGAFSVDRLPLFAPPLK